MRSLIVLAVLFLSAGCATVQPKPEVVEEAPFPSAVAFPDGSGSNEMWVCLRDDLTMKCMDFERFMLLLQEQGLIRISPQGSGSERKM
jgi:hypothetical protein